MSSKVFAAVPLDDDCVSFGDRVLLPYYGDIRFLTEAPAPVTLKQINQEQQWYETGWWETGRKLRSVVWWCLSGLAS